MQIFRRISLPAHGLIELTAGLALVVASFVLGLGGAWIVLTFVAGAVIAGMGLGVAESFPLSTHQAIDRLMATLLAAASVAAALSGQDLAAIVLLAGAILQLTLSAATRWTRAPVTH